MKKSGFSRRDFVSAGSVLAASAVVSSVSCQSSSANGGKSRGMLNAIDFGAKGDGTTDDTEAIQKALDQAACIKWGSIYSGRQIPLFRIEGPCRYRHSWVASMELQEWNGNKTYLQRGRKMPD